MAKQFDYEDKLREGVEERVSRYIRDMKDNHPPEFDGVSPEALERGITDNTMGILLGVLDALIAAGAFRQAGLIRWARTHKS